MNRTVQFVNAQGETAEGLFVGYYNHGTVVGDVAVHKVVAFVETFKGHVHRVEIENIRFTDMESWITAYVVFKDPVDFPDKHVIRKQFGPYMQEIIAVADDYQDVIVHMPKGLKRFNRLETDSNSVVETWR